MKYLILNTSVSNDQSFNCMTRTENCSLTSKKYNLLNFQGRVIFDLEQVKGKNLQDKVNKVLSKINFDFIDSSTSPNNRIARQNRVEDAINELKLAKSHINYYIGSFIKDFIIEVSSSIPYSISSEKLESGEMCEVNQQPHRRAEGYVITSTLY